MYCVCNGKELKIFRTDFAPEAALVKEFKYQEFETEFDNIANILSPDVIRKTWPIIEIDSGKLLGKGLRSFAQVVGGTFAYRSMSSPHPLMRGMRMPMLADLLFTIVSGFVERINDKLRVVVITRSPSIEGQRISESIGIIEWNSGAMLHRSRTIQMKQRFFHTRQATQYLRLALAC